MAEKPTYDNLERRIETLEKDLLRSISLEKELNRLLELSPDLIGSGNLDGIFTNVNTAFKRTLGYSGSEFYKKPFTEFIHPDDVAKTRKALSDAIDGKRNIYIENRYRCKDGSYKCIDWFVLALARENKFLAVGRDITDRKQMEEELDDKNKNLIEINAALNALIKNMESKKSNFEEQVMANIQQLVLPYLEKIKDTTLDSTRESLINIAETNLRKVSADFSHRLSSSLYSLTPTEIKVANLVKLGYTTKEITATLGIAYKTVESHRERIRKKLGINNQKINLRAHLLST